MATRVWTAEVLQTAHFLDIQSSGNRRITIRREKLPRFRRMLIRIQRHTKRLFHIRRLPRDIQQHPVGVGLGDVQTVLPRRKSMTALVILLGRAEGFFGESAPASNSAAVALALGIVKLREKIRECLAVS